ncbi:MAG: hypothetical protein OXG27_12660 [Chloroflexi bacterium]|nr:hypothetical protein [Chloroflexota bacterium]
MTAATTINTRRPTLEELVDRIIDAIFGPDETVQPTTSPARNIHKARRLRQSGDFDAALAVFVDLDLSGATDGERRWAFAEFIDLARRRFHGENAWLYSPATGRAAVLTRCGTGALQVEAVLGMRWRPGKLVSRRSLRGVTPLAKGAAP